MTGKQISPQSGRTGIGSGVRCRYDLGPNGRDRGRLCSMNQRLQTLAPGTQRPHHGRLYRTVGHIADVGLAQEISTG